MAAAAAEPAHLKPRRRWFSISLRTLLLLVAVLAIWLGWQTNRARKQRRAVAAVLERGGTVRYLHQARTHPIRLENFHLSAFDIAIESPGPDWLREFLGDDYFQDVIFVALEGTGNDGGDQLAALVSGLPELEYLKLSSCGLTDDGLRHLSSNTTLRILGIDRNQITDDGLRHLADLTRLESLDVSMMEGITGSGFHYLADLEELRALDLQYTSLDGDYLHKLRGLTQLYKLMLSVSAIDDSHLEHVGNLDSLVILSIDRTRVQGAGLAHLTKLSSLEQLYLDESAAHEGLKHLQQLPTQTSIAVESNDPSDYTLRQLKQALPQHTVRPL